MQSKTADFAPEVQFKVWKGTERQSHINYDVTMHCLPSQTPLLLSLYMLNYVKKKHDTQKTRNTQHIALSSEEVWATASGYIHKKLAVLTSGFWDMPDRRTDWHTDTLITLHHITWLFKGIGTGALKSSKFGQISGLTPHRCNSRKRWRWNLTIDHVPTYYILYDALGNSSHQVILVQPITCTSSGQRCL